MKGSNSIGQLYPQGKDEKSRKKIDPLTTFSSKIENFFLISKNVSRRQLSIGQIGRAPRFEGVSRKRRKGKFSVNIPERMVAWIAIVFLMVPFVAFFYFLIGEISMRNEVSSREGSKQTKHITSMNISNVMNETFDEISDSMKSSMHESISVRNNENHIASMGLNTSIPLITKDTDEIMSSFRKKDHDSDHTRNETNNTHHESQVDTSSRHESELISTTKTNYSSLLSHRPEMDESD